MMPTRFDALPTATWPRLRNLLDGHAAGWPGHQYDHRRAKT